MEHVQLTTTDGHLLTGDLAESDGDPGGAVVICHPHPLRGGNRFDVVAALDHLADRYPGAELHSAGYSFGAVVSLAVDDDRIASKVAVAPPLSMMPVDPPRQPTLVLVAEHDQYCPPSAVRPIIATWPDATMEVIASSDHFLAGHATATAATAAAWLSRA